MCVRASRGLLRLRSRAAGPPSAAVVDTVRSLCTDKPPAGGTGGLAQAILQERLQQQQQSQVSLARTVAILFRHRVAPGSRRVDGGEENGISHHLNL